MPSRVPLTFDHCKTAISEEIDFVLTMHEGLDLLLESISTYMSTIDHVAWRVTPTTDLGKPLDLLLHPPSEKEEKRAWAGAGVVRGRRNLGEERRRIEDRRSRSLHFTLG